MDAVFTTSTILAFFVLVMATILAYKDREGWVWLVFIAFLIITSGPRTST